ncbi:hypothetical protein J6590_093703 [Homalodisca vitripennis]|nr:hypothetical protein J6590_093703 [Homalodisca vitripennis]
MFPSISKDEEPGQIVTNLTLRVLSSFCVLDAELAKEYFFFFCFKITKNDLSITALKCVFDLLLVYGLSYFNIQDPDEETNEGSEETEQKNLVVLLMSLLECKSDDKKRVAVTGLSKLLFSGRVKSSKLVVKLIMLWFDPNYECDPYIRQTLGIFFRMFATSCSHAPQLLLQAFLPTIKKFFALDFTDPLAEIDVETVANLMVDLTRPNINKRAPKRDWELHYRLKECSDEAVTKGGGGQRVDRKSIVFKLVTLRLVLRRCQVYVCACGSRGCHVSRYSFCYCTRVSV